MRQETVALNYAEVLFALADKSGEHERYADLMDTLASAIEQAPKVQSAACPTRRETWSCFFRRW